MAQIPLRMLSEFSLSDFSTRFGWGYQNKNSQMNFWAESETKRSGSICGCPLMRKDYLHTIFKTGCGLRPGLYCKQIRSTCLVPIFFYSFFYISTYSSFTILEIISRKDRYVSRQGMWLGSSILLGLECNLFHRYL